MVPAVINKMIGLLISVHIYPPVIDSISISTVSVAQVVFIRKGENADFHLHTVMLSSGSFPAAENVKRMVSQSHKPIPSIKCLVFGFRPLCTESDYFRIVQV